MFKLKGLLAILLLVALALTGCSSGSKIKSGATQMRTVLANVKKAIDANDAAKAKTEADNLEQAWAKFEDLVKEKDKSLYQDIEEPLHAIEAGVKASPLDQKLLSTQAEALDGLLVPLTK